MLSSSELRSVYDLLGQRQDTQKFYEGPALDNLLAHAGFETAKAVFEVGTGTGAFAELLLRQYLPPEAEYTGVDLSAVMVALTRKKLAPFADRVRVYQTSGDLAFSIPTASMDSVVSNYVIDLLSEAAIATLIREAGRMLRPGGRLCLVGLTPGRTPLSKLVSSVWQLVYQIAPRIVGGCRPLRSSVFVEAEAWRLLHHDYVRPYNIPSEILILEKRPAVRAG